MAAVARGTKIRPCGPVGYEYVSANRTVTVDVLAGQLLRLTANGWVLADGTNPTHMHGFAAQDYKAGRNDCSILKQWEMDGFAGMTPGVPLYPSTTVPGGLDTTPVDGFVALIHADSATRIVFTL